MNWDAMLDAIRNFAAWCEDLLSLGRYGWPISEADDHLRIKRDYEKPGRRVSSITLRSCSSADGSSYATYDVAVELLTGETRRYLVNVSADSYGDRTLIPHKKWVPATTSKRRKPGRLPR